MRVFAAFHTCHIEMFVYSFLYDFEHTSHALVKQCAIEIEHDQRHVLAPNTCATATIGRLAVNVLSALSRQSVSHGWRGARCIDLPDSLGDQSPQTTVHRLLGR